MNRRTLLKTALNGTGLFVAGTVAGPGLIAAFDPALRSYPPEWVPLGRLEEFPVGEMRDAVARLRHAGGPEILEKSVYVLRRDPQNVIVFSRSCTDLGCPVTYDSASRCFYCPCHGGIFDRDGDPMAGPPPRPLWRYVTRVRDGTLEIDLRSVPPVA